MPSCLVLFHRVAVPWVFHARKSFLIPHSFWCYKEDFSQGVSPQDSPLLLHLHLQFGVSPLSGCFSQLEGGERHLATWRADQNARGYPKTLQPQQQGVSGMHQRGWGFPFLTASAHLLLLRARFVAPVSRIMPAIAAYFVVRPHTFLFLFAPAVRKTWGLAQTLCLLLTATTPRWISPLVD